MRHRILLFLVAAGLTRCGPEPPRPLVQWARLNPGTPPAGIGHADPIRQARADILRFEAVVPHMYCDPVGKVTVGAGFLLDRANHAAALPFEVRQSGRPAVDRMIREEWRTVKDAFAGNHAAGYYRHFTQLVLPEDAIHRELDRRLATTERQIRGYFPHYPRWPSSARQAMLDMAYNLGSSGVIRKFPRFTAACRAGNWAEAGRQSRRPQLSEARNQAIRDLFREARH